MRRSTPKLKDCDRRVLRNNAIYRDLFKERYLTKEPIYCIAKETASGENFSIYYENGSHKFLERSINRSEAKDLKRVDLSEITTRADNIAKNLAVLTNWINQAIDK